MTASAKFIPQRQVHSVKFWYFWPPSEIRIFLSFKMYNYQIFLIIIPMELNLPVRRLNFLWFMIFLRTTEPDFKGYDKHETVWQITPRHSNTRSAPDCPAFQARNATTVTTRRLPEPDFSAFLLNQANNSRVVQRSRFIHLKVAFFLKTIIPQSGLKQ